MASSSIPTVIDTLIATLEARAALKGVSITDGVAPPADMQREELIQILDADGEQSVRALNRTTQPRNEEYDARGPHQHHRRDARRPDHAEGARVRAALRDRDSAAGGSAPRDLERLRRRRRPHQVLVARHGHAARGRDRVRHQRPGAALGG
jgi:hypothetical protein